MRTSKMRLLLCLVPLVGVTCGSEIKATRAIVEVYSDVQELVAVEVEVRGGPDDDHRNAKTFAVSAPHNDDSLQFLLSFAIAPRPGQEEGSFFVKLLG